MTIDDNVDFLNEAKKLFEDIANNPNINETIKTYFIIESLETAIGIMQKYQKIEQLIAMDDENHRRTIKLCELKEVLEDGNNTGNN